METSGRISAHVSSICMSFPHVAVQQDPFRAPVTMNLARCKKEGWVNFNVVYTCKLLNQCLDILRILVKYPNVYMSISLNCSFYGYFHGSFYYWYIAVTPVAAVSHFRNTAVKRNALSQAVHPLRQHTLIPGHPEREQSFAEFYKRAEKTANASCSCF